MVVLILGYALAKSDIFLPKSSNKMSILLKWKFGLFLILYVFDNWLYFMLLICTKNSDWPNPFFFSDAIVPLMSAMKISNENKLEYFHALVTLHTAHVQVKTLVISCRKKIHKLIF